MKLGFDYYQNLETPVFVLCKPNGDRIGTINCTEKKGSIKFNDCDEINFTTYLYTDGKKNNIYERVNNLMHLELPNIGRYVIANVTIHSEGTKHEYKECSAISEEVLIAQKYIETFVINKGTTESLDGVSLYNLSNPNKSLLHLVLEKCPDWTIGHVDNDLQFKQRSFEIDRQDIYSFLTTDVSQAFECVFVFDSVQHRINVYKDDTVGEDTNIHISYANLLKNAQISTSTDEIKTCLTVTGSEDLNFREVNMGSDRIYNLDYFHDLEYMSKGLYDAYKKWKNLWDSKVTEYEKLLTDYTKYEEQILELTSNKMPDDPESTNWSEYGLKPLEEKLSVYETKQSVMIKSGQAEKTHKDYKTVYLPCYNTIQEIKKQIELIKVEITNIENYKKSVNSQMSDIQNLVNMKTNFTSSQLTELTKFIREDEISSENYVTTEEMTEEERSDMLHDMLKYGQKELAKVSVPIMDFSMDMVNIYAVPEFKNKMEKFNVGNYMFVTIRDEFTLKVRLLSMDINFYDKSDFSVTFGNITKMKGSKLFEDVTNALELASSAATTVSFNSSNWNKANVESTEIGKMLSDGLLASGNRISTTESDVVISDKGIIITNNPNTKYKDDVIFLGGGQIVFSDDGLKTVKTALGRVSYTKPDGTTYDDFGLLAQFIISGYVGGSVIEGGEIIGTKITNGNGTFTVDEKGHMTAVDATLSGTITANKGYIGGEKNGFTIDDGKFYAGNRTSLEVKTDLKQNGIYIGTDGISLGKSNSLILKSDGSLIASNATLNNANLSGTITANKGTIGGAVIEENCMRSKNGSWLLNSDGTAVFKNVAVTASQGSTFGGITYSSDGITTGNFGGGFSAGMSFSLSGGALNNFNNLVARNITAENIMATNVLADYVHTDKTSTNRLVVGNIALTFAIIDGHNIVTWVYDYPNNENNQ